jgi:RNA polymerase sigma factor (sigma-70 family)
VTQQPAAPRDRGSAAAPRLDADATDEMLVAAVVARHPAALDLLYARYGRPAFGLARRVTGDDGFAEDVVQEVFLTLWRDPGRFDSSRGVFASWLLSITHHKAVDAVRREESLRRRRAEATEEMAARLDDSARRGTVDEEVWASLRRERVRGALSQLPAPQREALALAYFGGYTQREVSALTGAPLGTVKTRMLAGMRRLAQLLGDSTRTEEDRR